MWDTPAGKQIVTSGHGKMIAYDLKTGAEKWSVGGMPAGCCNSPVLAKDTIYFAGWSPGQDKDFKMPSFDDLLKMAGQEKVGFLTKESYDKGPMKGFFEHHDLNGDGKITRDEWAQMLKFMNEGKSGAFAVKAGGKGEITKSHVLWKATKGVPHVTTAIVYRGQLVMVKDGGIVTAYDTKTGGSGLHGARRSAQPLLRLSGGGERALLLHKPRRRCGHGPQGRRQDAGGRGDQSEVG